MKATGTGIAIDLQAVEFKVNTIEILPQVCLGNHLYLHFVKTLLLLLFVVSRHQTFS